MRSFLFSSALFASGCQGNPKDGPEDSRDTSALVDHNPDPDSCELVGDGLKGELSTFRCEDADGTFFLTRAGGHARLCNVLGKLMDEGTGDGVLGGDQASIASAFLSELHENAAEQCGAPAYLTVNSAFFADESDPTGTAFPLLANNETLAVQSDGYASKTEFQDPFSIRLLAFASDGSLPPVVLSAASIEALMASAVDYDNHVAGLSPDADKESTEKTGRTFVGIASDGVLWLYSSQASTQAKAQDRLGTLAQCSPEEMMMLDGGTSAGAIWQLEGADSEPLVVGLRKVPAALSVFVPN